MMKKSPSPVVITGTVDAVVIARHQLIDYLPLVLMCDMKENSNPDNNQVQVRTGLSVTFFRCLSLESRKFDLTFVTNSR